MRISVILFALLFPAGCCLVPLAEWLPEDPEPEPPAPAPSDAIDPLAAPVASPPMMPLASSVGAPSAPSDVGPRVRLGALSRTAGGGRLPQAEGLRGLYARSRRRYAGTLERGLLVCSARLHGGGHDDGFFAGGADVALATRIGDSGLRSTAQTSTRLYSFPVAHLEAGDAVWIRVVDRDVFSDDTIAEGSARYAEAPFTLTMGQADVECRAVDPALVARRSGSAIDALSAAIDRLGGVAPDVQAYDLGYPSDRAQRVAAASDRVLAWTDAGDDRYERQLERADAFDDDWERRASAAVRAAAERLPSADTPVVLGRGRRIHVLERACGVDAVALSQQMGDASIDTGGGGCLVTVAMDAARPIQLPSLDRPEAQWEAWAIDDAARTWTARTVARRHRGAWVPADQPLSLAAGERVELVLSLPAGADPTLLRVRDGARPVVLRLP